MPILSWKSLVGIENALSRLLLPTHGKKWTSAKFYVKTPQGEMLLESVYRQFGKLTLRLRHVSMEVIDPLVGFCKGSVTTQPEEIGRMVAGRAFLYTGNVESIDNNRRFSVLSEVDVKPWAYFHFTEKAARSTVPSHSEPVLMLSLFISGKEMPPKNETPLSPERTRNILEIFRCHYPA